jgi:hypothetical protein
VEFGHYKNKAKFGRKLKMKKWHYITDSGEYGPISSSELRNLFNGGSINWQTSIWKEGMSSWEPLSFHRNIVSPHKALSNHSPDSVTTKRSEAKEQSEHSHVAVETSTSHDAEQKIAQPFSEQVRDGKGVQHGIIVTAVASLLGMVLFPPFQVTHLGTIHNMGYSFLLNPPFIRGITASVAVQTLLAQIMVLLIITGALWYQTRNYASASEGRPASGVSRSAAQFFKNAGLFLIASVCAAALYGVLVIVLSGAVQYFAEQGMINPFLFFDSYLKLNALALFSFWAWISGKLLDWEKPRLWGRWGFYVYLVAPSVPFFLSFFVAT